MPSIDSDELDELEDQWGPLEKRVKDSTTMPCGKSGARTRAQRKTHTSRPKAKKIRAEKGFIGMRRKRYGK